MAGRAGAVREATDSVCWQVSGAVSGDATTEILAASVMSCGDGVLAGGVNRMQSAYRAIFVTSVFLRHRVTGSAFNDAAFQRVGKPCC